MTKQTPDQIRADRDRQLAAVRARRDLTPQARQVAIVRIQDDAERKMKAVQQADTEHYHRRRGSLEREFLGGSDTTGAGAMSARDAREKAAKLTDPREAQAAFQRAQRAGDTDMVKAIAAHAAEHASTPVFGQAWQPIVAAYADTSPAKADTYRELASLREPNTRGDWSYVLDTPSELGRLTATQRAHLASSDLTIGDVPQTA